MVFAPVISCFNRSVDRFGSYLREQCRSIGKVTAEKLVNQHARLERRIVRTLCLDSGIRNAAHLWPFQMIKNMLELVRLDELKPTYG